MATMKAARIHEWGGPDKIRIDDDVPVPEPKANEVLVQVKSASVNPVDLVAIGGHMGNAISLPYIPGWDIAGDVVAAGSEVQGIKVGDAVYGNPTGGAFAQYVATPAMPNNVLALKPAGLDYDHAAALPVISATAWQALFEVGGLDRGKKVLIHAAAGGVGHWAVQLAKWKNAYVVATASGENESFVRELGADEFIDYQKTRFEDVVKDADLVLVTVAGDTLERSYTTVKPGGILVSIVGKPDEEKAKAKGIRAASAAGRNSNRAQLDRIARQIDAGFLKPQITSSYPLEQLPQALEIIASHHARGKIVITIPEPK